MTSIREVQDMMANIYLSRDSRRGAQGTFRWLKEEVEELGEAMQKTDKTSLEDEFADVLAWLASLANVLEIDLERATLRKYDYSCPKCASSPCECSHV